LLLFFKAFAYQLIDHTSDIEILEQLGFHIRRHDQDEWHNTFPCHQKRSHTVLARGDERLYFCRGEQRPKGGLACCDILDAGAFTQ
jgi:hypothetical protein